jgi:YHS domain-containing protein
MILMKRICFRVTNFAALLLIAAWAAALAGDFYEKDGVAIKGYDPVAYFTDNKPVKGLPAYKAEYGGSVFHFVSQANRDAFAANPAKYAPQYNGFCAFGTAGGYKAAIDPAAFTIVKQTLLELQPRGAKEMEYRHPWFCC